MSTARLSGAAWSFVGASLRESVAIWRSLGISAIDLLAVPGLLVDSSEIVSHPNAVAAQIQELHMPVANLIFSFGASFSDRALNDADASVRARNSEEWDGLLEFCRLCSIPSITVLPGVQQPGWSREKSLAVAAENMNELAARAAKGGITLLFEAHVQSILEGPCEVLDFLSSNPDLKLTLDYSHFVWNCHSQQEIDCLVPYAGHVHLRQGAPKVLQARWADGTIDFGKVVRLLEDSGYQGYYGLEYEHDPWMGNDKVDVISETIKMRDPVRTLVA
jgi:sugar phosphate isomerase/epimerase